MTDTQDGANEHYDPQKREFNEMELVKTTASSEFSYLDFVIEKKFYRKFWKLLGGLLAVITVTFSILAFMGYNRVSDILEFWDEFEKVKNKLNPIYDNYMLQDSIKIIHDENSEYFFESVRLNDPVSRQYIQTCFLDEGFRIPNAEIESWLRQSEGIWNNKAIEHTYSNAEKEKGITYVGIVHNGIPEKIQDRIRLIVKSTYRSSNIMFFEDDKVPSKLFIYYIDEGL